MQSEHFDVVIIGAGISGLGAACHLQRECPGKSYVILEGRETIGGTWSLFKYPGIRSDSDLYTFGYDFKPWYGNPIATAPEILRYLHEVVDENELEPKIRFNHWVEKAAWSSEDAAWGVNAKTSDGDEVRITGQFLFMCQGYYNYQEGYQPEFPGQETFKGDLIHPQKWPEDLDYTDKNMVIIGSGATAATIVPAVADKVAHVTQLQRSPSYYYAMDNTTEEQVILNLRELDVSEDTIYQVKRDLALNFGEEIAEKSRQDPEATKQELIELARADLPEDFDIDKHLTPSYGPWKERLCLLPDGDMFKAIASGKASIATDEIDQFVEDGILLKSGDHLAADIIVSATGIELCGLGDVEFSVDGESVDASQAFAYHGMMMSGMPNLAWSFGYIRTSWTMRSDMIAHYVCRLLNYMDEKGVTHCTPTLRAEDTGMNGKGFIDPDDFAPGYMRRGVHRLPKQSDQGPWVNSQDYYKEKDIIPNLEFEDDALVFSGSDDQQVSAG